MADKNSRTGIERRDQRDDVFRVIARGITTVRLVAQAVPTLIDRDAAKPASEPVEQGLEHRRIRCDAVKKNRQRTLAGLPDVEGDAAGIDAMHAN